RLDECADSVVVRADMAVDDVNTRQHLQQAVVKRPGVSLPMCALHRAEWPVDKAERPEPRRLECVQAKRVRLRDGSRRMDFVINHYENTGADGGSRRNPDRRSKVRMRIRGNGRQWPHRAGQNDGNVEPEYEGEQP